jgi:hypothetical protein
MMLDLVNWLVCGTLVCGAAPQAADTGVTLRGLLAAVPNAAAIDARWVLALPQPVAFQGHRFAELEVQGNARAWARYDRFFVEARGTLAVDTDGTPRLRLAGVKEANPEGLVRREVSVSFSQRVALSVFVLPRRIRWRDADGKATGESPVVVFALANHGQGGLTIEFPTQDFTCFKVEPEYGGRVWEYAYQLDQPTDQLQVKLPQFVRETVRMPEEAAPQPGSYRVRAGLCGLPEYQVETEIEVVR